MTWHKLKEVGNAVVRHDGLAATFDVMTLTAPPLKVEFPIDDAGNFIAFIANLSREAGRMRGLPPGFEPNEPVTPTVIPASSVAVMLGSQGKVNLVFRIGSLDLAMEIDQRVLQHSAKELSALADTLGREPGAVQ